MENFKYTNVILSCMYITKLTNADTILLNKAISKFYKEHPDERRIFYGTVITKALKQYIKRGKKNGRSPKA